MSEHLRVFWDAMLDPFSLFFSFGLKFIWIEYGTRSELEFMQDFVGRCGDFNFSVQCK